MLVLFIAYALICGHTQAVLDTEQIDITRARCYSRCLQQHGTYQSPDPEVLIYDFYKPNLRCESIPCQNCLLPCNRLFDSLSSCRRSCDTQTCKDSCGFIFDALDNLLQTGDNPVSVGSVTVGQVEQCCQDVSNEQLNSSRNPSLEATEATSLYIRWNATALTGISLWETLGLPMSFLLRVRTRQSGSLTPWQTFHTMDAWLPLTVSTSTDHQFQVFPVLPDGIASNGSLSPWIRTHSGRVALQPPPAVWAEQEMTVDEIWVMVSWILPEVPFCHYELYILPEDTRGSAPKTKRISWLPEPKFRYGPLDFDSAYSIRLSACTRQFYCSSATAITNLNTASCIIATSNQGNMCDPEPPTEVKVNRLRVSEDGCTQSVSIEWVPPPYGTVGSTTGLQYILSWWEDVYTFREPTDLNLTSLQVNGSQFIVTDLRSNTEYQFTIRTLTSDGRTSDAEPFVVNTTKTDSLHCLPKDYLLPKDSNTKIPWMHVVLPCVLAVLILITIALIAVRYIRQNKTQKSNTNDSSKPRCLNNNPLYVPIDGEEGKEVAIAMQDLETDRFEIFSSQLEKQELLGEGAFGAVYRAVFLPKNNGGQNYNTEPQEVAVKYLKEYAMEDDRIRFLQEIELMKSLGRHPNVVSMVACVSRGKEPALVMDFCRHGDLREYLRSLRQSLAADNVKPVEPDTKPPASPSKPAPAFRSSRLISDSGDDVKEQRLLSYARQIALGMEFLASRKFVHRDLAARNVLVCDRQLVKISDFGLTRDVYEDSAYHKSGAGKLPVKWMSVEAIFDQIYTTQSDVWSFGVVLWEIVTLGGSPYPGISTQNLYRMLKDGYRMERPDNCSEDIYSIMMSCWESEPAARPSFASLKEKFDVMLEAKLENECAYISFNMGDTLGLYPQTTSCSSQPHLEECQALDAEVSCANTCDIELSLNMTKGGSKD